MGIRDSGGGSGVGGAVSRGGSGSGKTAASGLVSLLRLTDLLLASS